MYIRLHRVLAHDCGAHVHAGEPLEAFVFMGPVYYQKLKHMVAGQDARPSDRDRASCSLGSRRRAAAVTAACASVRPHVVTDADLPFRDYQ